MQNGLKNSWIPMRKKVFHGIRMAALLFVLLLLPCGIAMAQEEAGQAGLLPIDGSITISAPKSPSKPTNLTDGDVASYVAFVAKDGITVKQAEAAQGIYLQWHVLPDTYEILFLDGNGKTLSRANHKPVAVNDYVPCPDGTCGFSITFEGKAELSEVKLYGGGSLPDSVQQWEKAAKEPAVMLICGYPGDELLFFGGLVPSWLNDGVPFSIAYMSSYSRVRQEECLNALWELGVREYPYFLERGTKHNKDVSYLLSNWKQGPSTGAVKSLLIAVRPQVVVSFSETGEADYLYAYKDSFRKYRNFGEAQTAATGRIVASAVEDAAKAKKGYAVGRYFVKSAAGEGIIMDLTRGLGMYQDRSAASVAAALYESAYASMRTFQYTTAESYGLTLRYAADGTVACTGLLDGITYQALHEPVPTATPVPTPTPVPTATPAPTKVPEATAVPAATQDPSREEVPAGESADTKAVLPVTSIVLFGVSAVMAIALVAAILLRGKLAERKSLLIALLAVFGALAVLALSAGLLLYRNAAKAVPALVPVSTETPVPTPAPTETPAPAEEEQLPETAEEPSAEETAEAAETEEKAEEAAEPAVVSKYEEHFLHSDTEQEAITVDVDNGYWSYQSRDLAVFIHRYQSSGGQYSGENQPLVWFVADIYMREGTDGFRPAFSDEGRTGRTTVMPWLFSRSYKSVLFINGDNMLNMDVELKGTIIRDGHVYSNANKAADVAAWNHVTQQFDYYVKRTYTARELIEKGYDNTFSFGPIVLANGEIREAACNASNVSNINPRCGVGTAADGHTVAIVVDGRRPQYSVGVDLVTYAQMYLDYGCTDAYNLDGGVSSCIYFMGEQLNSHGNKKDYSQQRHMPDGLIFGYSEKVPTVDDPIYNDGTDRTAVEADYREATPTPAPTATPETTPNP